MDHDIVPDIIVLSTCTVLVGWGLMLIFNARAIAARNPLRATQPPPSDRMIYHRVMGVFWLCVGVGAIILWLMEGQSYWQRIAEG